MKILNAAAITIATMLIPVVNAVAAERAIIVLDGSASMWGQIDGVPKLDIARRALRDVLESAPGSLELGLMAYGHREKGNCADIELLVPPHTNAGMDIAAAADKMKFLGKTPISAAVSQAADALRFSEDKATVILITDGIETCEADPCAIAAELEERGLDFTAHVVGFGLSPDEGKQVSCLADVTGGRYFSAGNAAELTQALTHVQSAMDTQLEAEPEPEAEATVELSGPEQVTNGAAFDFTWTDAINGNDFITIVPAGADEGTVKSHIRVHDNDKGRLTAPGTPGLYELRYVAEDGRRTLASTSVEVVEAEVGLSGPEQVTNGAAFEFTWTDANNGNDFITIVPVGADEGTVKSHIRVHDDEKGRLTAPGTPGLYELRYVLDEGRRMLASIPVEVVETEVGLSGPDEVMNGAAFDFTWTGAVNGNDFITIVPAGADEGMVKSHIRVHDDDKGRLTAPGTPGLYELRYVLDEGRRTLASSLVEVVEAEVGITGPGIIRAGTAVDIAWSATINGNDFITIVHAGADEGKVETHIRTQDATEGRMKAPDAVGLYEIRYVLEEGRRTLASASLEVVAADAPLDDGAGLDVPNSARPGDVITISWVGGTDSADQRISLARADQPDFSWIAVHKVGSDKTLTLEIPEEAGSYEVRYLDISKRKVLGRAIVDVK